MNLNPTHDRAAAMLSDVAAMSARADASGKAIKTGAVARLDAVNKRMDELRPTVLTTADDATEYQALLIERHRLNVVTAS